MSKPFSEYGYFDTPDGEDTAKKLFVGTRTAGIAALGIATCDVFLYSHPKGYMQTLGRYAYICLPILGMSTAFIMLSNMSASIRHKDDKLNWIIGAVAAGGIFGAWRKSTVAGTSACIGFSLAAAFKKHAVQNNWTLAEHDVKPQYGGVTSVRQDYTLMAHRPGNWTTGK